MRDLKQSFPSSAPINEKHEVTTKRDAATGTVTFEAWWKDDKLDRARRTGCAGLHAENPSRS
jgi:hypothetical protein